MMDARLHDYVNHDNPWPGLSPYTDHDSQWFFGRSRELKDLARRVEQNTLTILFSRSGIGKSSLLRAALLPQLRKDSFQPVYVRLDFSDAAPSLVNQVWNLIEHYINLPPRYKAVEAGAMRPSFWEFFHDMEEGLLTESLKGINMVLIFDQFEEVFTLGERSEMMKQRVLDLIDEIADLAENRPPSNLQGRFNAGQGDIERFDFDAQPCHQLIALREDYLSHLERHRQRLPMLMQNRMPLNPLTGEQALQAVLEPASHLLDGSVAERIVRFIGGNENDALSALVIDPSLLNLICRELNLKRQEQGQKRLTSQLLGGSREVILETFYDKCFDGLDDKARVFVEKELLTTSGYRESVSEERAKEYVGKGAVEHLINRRLLSAEERGGMRRVELSHDLLAEVSLRRREERILTEQAEAKEQERQKYQAQVLAEKQKQARFVRVAALMGLLFVAAGIAAVFAWSKEREASIARNEKAHDSSEADFLLASEYHRTGRSALALAHLARSLRSDPHNLPAADSALGLLLNPSTEVGWLPEFPELNHDDLVTSAKWNARGDAMLAVAGESVVVWKIPHSSADQIPKASARFQHLNKEGQSVVVRGAVWSPDGKMIASWAADFSVRLWRVGSNQMLPVLEGHTDTVNSVAFNPEGTALVSASYDHTARVWSVDGKPLKTLAGHKLCINQAAWSPDGHFIATASDDGTAKIWDAGTSVMVREMNHQQRVDSIEFGLSRREPRLLTVGKTGSRWWNWETGGEVVSVPLTNQMAVAGRISPDGHLAGIATELGTSLHRLFGDTKSIAKWEFQTKKQADHIEFSPEGRRLLLFNGEILRIWSTDTGEPFGKPLRLPAPVAACSWSPDARRIAVAAGTQIFVWDASDGEPLVVTAPSDLIIEKFFQAALLDDGKMVGTISKNVARVWSAQTGAPRGRPIMVKNASDVVAFSPNGRWFVVALNNRVERYDTITGKRAAEFVAHEAEIQYVSFSTDGTRFVTASTDHSVKVWETTSGHCVATFAHPNAKEFGSAVFSADGAQILAIGYDNAVFLADAATGQLVIEPLRHSERVHAADISQDGRFIVTASDDRTAKVWDAKTGKLLQTFPHLSGVFKARINADGSIIATLIRGSNQVDLWDRINGGKKGKPLIHQQDIGAFNFNQFGSRLVTVSADGSAQVWDTATGEPIGGSFLHEKKVIGAEFSKDGQRVLTACDDGRARIWETFSGGHASTDTSAAASPAWLPDLLDTVSSTSIDGTSMQDRLHAGLRGLRNKLDELKVPWRDGLNKQKDNYLRAAAWLSLGAEARVGSFGSASDAESERRLLLDSTSPAAIQRAFRLAPHSGQMQAALCRIEMDRERSDFLMKFALTHDSNDPEVVFQIAQSLDKRPGNTDEKKLDRDQALSLLEQALLKHPDNAHCLRYLGWLRSQQEKKAETIALFDRALKLTPNDPLLLEYYGFALSSLGMAREALEKWTKAVTFYNERPDANASDLRAGIAIGYWNLGNKKEARTNFEQLCDSDPDRDWNDPATIIDLPKDWSSGERASLSAMQTEFKK